MPHSAPRRKHRIHESTHALYHTFYKAWRDACARYPGLSTSATIRIAIRSEAPEWFVSPRTALAEIRAIQSVGTLAYLNPSPIRKALFIALYSRFRHRSLQNPDTPDARIIEDILDSPAPSFFISARTARRIIFVMRHNNNS